MRGFPGCVTHNYNLACLTISPGAWVPAVGDVTSLDNRTECGDSRKMGV